MHIIGVDWAASDERKCGLVLAELRERDDLRPRAALLRAIPHYVGQLAYSPRSKKRGRK